MFVRGDDKNVFNAALGEPVAALLDQHLPVMQLLRREWLRAAVLLDHLTSRKIQPAAAADNDALAPVPKKRPYHLVVPVNEAPAPAEVVIEAGIQAGDVFLEAAKAGLELGEMRQQPVFAGGRRTVHVKKRVEGWQPKRDNKHHTQDDIRPSCQRQAGRRGLHQSKAEIDERVVSAARQPDR